MKLSAYEEYLVNDLFSDVVGDVTVRKMFGSTAFYLDGRIFGFTGEDDGLLLKGNDETKVDFESLGGERFVYNGHKSKAPIPMPYWTVPEGIIEDKAALTEWIHRSAKLSKPKKT